jgi:hypothetical protein
LISFRTSPLLAVNPTVRRASHRFLRAHFNGASRQTIASNSKGAFLNGIVKPLPGYGISTPMVELLDLADRFRRKADECRSRAQNATSSIVKKEWTALGEQWQALADDIGLVSMINPSGWSPRSRK